LHVAEWLHHFKRCTVTAVRVYEDALANPKLAAEDRGRLRFQAACAAALAGTGQGLDTAKLTETEKATLRTKAHEWLELEYRRLDKARDANLTGLSREWLGNRDLAGVRHEQFLAKLPEAERIEWQKFWSTIKPPPIKTPPPDGTTELLRARSFVDKKAWRQAAESYSLFLKKASAQSAEVWFEYAATQLLAGDNEGYIESCVFLVAESKRGAKFRGYLVARTCTLAPDPRISVSSAAAQADFELKANGNAFWSLTEQGALHCRTKKYKEAVPLFQASLRAEPKNGAAVLNWLWLALAHHHLGEKEEAKSRLNKATTWLDGMGNQFPTNADAIGLHRHNWLEAHILRREVEELMREK
jgi:tetratricopeptide (TPR) repeat protein